MRDETKPPGPIAVRQRVRRAPPPDVSSTINDFRSAKEWTIQRRGHREGLEEDSNSLMQAGRSPRAGAGVDTGTASSAGPYSPPSRAVEGDGPPEETGAHSVVYAAASRLKKQGPDARSPLRRHIRRFAHTKKCQTFLDKRNGARRYG